MGADEVGEARLPQPEQVVDRGLRAGENDEVGCAEPAGVALEAEPYAGTMTERVEIVEVGQVGQGDDHDVYRAGVC